MRRSRLLLGLIPALPVALAVGACAETPVSIGLVMKAPLGLLDDAKSITLSVFEADEGVGCDKTTGRVTRMPSGSDVQTFPLENTGCAAGVAWCKQIEVDQSKTEKIFYILAKGDAGATIGEGCNQLAVTQDPLAVEITLRRYNPPACCNNGKIEVGETCDTNEDAATACDGSAGGECRGIVKTESCACDCTSEEVLVSIDNLTPPNLKNGPPGSKRELAMTFAPGKGETANGLHAVFVHEAADSAYGDLHTRVLSQDLETIDDSLLGLQLRLSPDCQDLGGTSTTPLMQQSPAIAATGNKLAIVYSSEEKVSGTFDIYLNVQNDNNCADGPPAQLTNAGGSNPLLSSTMPDVAAGGAPGMVLVTWQRSGSIFSRLVNTATPNAPGMGIPIAQGKNARVAGSEKGWVVVYEGPNEDVFMRRIGFDGLPTSGAEPVNSIQTGTQDQPDVAMLDDGRFMVVWHDANGDEIRFQRYDANGAKVAGDDQAEPLNVASPDTMQRRPVAAAGLDFFAVAWEDVGGSVSARYVGAQSGFRYNPGTGQHEPFLASRSDIPDGARSAPAIAVGGRGYVAIGWQANAANHHGIYVRRFPLPL
jgi:hypothetical protein